MARRNANYGGGFIRRLRWIKHKPTAYTSGDLYFEVEMATGRVQYARLIGASNRRLQYWVDELLRRTSAVRVTELYIGGVK